MIVSVTNNNHINTVESSTPLQIKKFMETFVKNINSIIHTINVAYNKNHRLALLCLNKFPMIATS